MAVGEPDSEQRNKSEEWGEGEKRTIAVQIFVQILLVVHQRLVSHECLKKVGDGDVSYG